MKEPRTIRELYIWLNGRLIIYDNQQNQNIKDINGIKDVICKQIDEVAEELNIHKQNHWKVISALIGAVTIFFGVINFIFKYVKK